MRSRCERSWGAVTRRARRPARRAPARPRLGGTGSSPGTQPCAMILPEARWEAECRVFRCCPPSRCALSMLDLPARRIARDHRRKERPLRGLAVYSPPPARSRHEAAKGEKPVPGGGGLGRPPVAALPPGSGKTRGKARAQRAPPRTSHWSRALQSRSPIRLPYPRLPSAGPPWTASEAAFT